MQDDEDRNEPQDGAAVQERAPTEAGELGGSDDVEQGAEDAERLAGHSRPGADAAGINPSRGQQSRTPEHD